MNYYRSQEGSLEMARLGPVPAGVGDRRPGLGREQRQDLLVLPGELLPALLVGQIEVAHLRTTLRPMGPRVTRTAVASWLTPRRIPCRASS